MDLLAETDSTARRRWRLFGWKQLCRACEVALVDPDERATFTMRRALFGGGEVTVTLVAPALRCPRCGRAHIPARLSNGDPYHLELEGLLTETASQSLHWK
jgi:hypothetical protein